MSRVFVRHLPATIEGRAAEGERGLNVHLLLQSHHRCHVCVHMRESGCVRACVCVCAFVLLASYHLRLRLKHVRPKLL